MPPESNNSLDISDTSMTPQENISSSFSGAIDSHLEYAPIENPVVSEPVDERLASFIHDDEIYQDMIRTLDREKIRLRLSLRYTILMFGIFLAFAWIVNNRIIMFGFSEFVWLARIRDALFGLMAGLFSLTLWYGSPVWFSNNAITFILRIFALIFFGGVLLGLYFPII